MLCDALADLLLAPSDTAVQNLAREGVAGDVVLTGDVMARRRAARAAVRRRERRSASCYAVEPGEFVLLTAHRAANVDTPQALTALVELIESLETMVVLPLHPRTQQRLEKLRPDPPARRASSICGCCRRRLPRDDRAGVGRARRADRLGRTAEGSRLAGHAVPDAAAVHRVGRDAQRRLEHAGRARPRRAPRRRCAPVARRAIRRRSTVPAPPGRPWCGRSSRARRSGPGRG